MENKTQNEYDLLDLLMAMWNGVVSAMKWCEKKTIDTCKLAYKYKFFMLAAILLGIACGTYLSIKHNRVLVHTAESQLHIYVTDAYQVAEQLSLLDNLSKNEQYDLLANATGLSKEQAKTIKRVNSYFVLVSQYDYALSETDYTNSYLQDTTVRRIMTYLTVDVQLSKPDMMDTLAPVLESYIRNNPYMQENIRLRRSHLLTMHNQYVAEYAKLDSLRSLEYFAQDRNASKMQLQGGVFVNEKTKQLYHHEAISLKESMQSVENELAYVERGVMFQHGFSLKKIQLAIIMTVTKTSILLVFLALVCLGFWDNRKRILEILQH